MTIKERNQNPVIGDNLNLRLFTYNSNHRQNVANVEKVDIYQLDSSCATDENPEGRRLVMSVDESDVVVVNDPFGGQYVVSVELEDLKFTIGKYVDVWTVSFDSVQSGTVTNEFRIVSDLWYASDMPIVYDFSYGFRPNRVRRGERRWLSVDIVPNVPNASDLQRYYVNLAVASPVKIFIEKQCGNCVPKERDLRMVVEGADVEHRHDSEGYYFLDTVALDMDCGIYDVWFELEFGENKYISEPLQLQIF